MAGAYFRGLRPGKPRPTSREQGRGRSGGLRRRGVWRNSGSLWRLEVVKPWQARTVCRAVVELAPIRVILGAKTPDLKGGILWHT